MTDPGASLPSVWRDALEQALEAHKDAESPVLFLEERVDLRVELASGRPPHSVTSFWSGLAARGGKGSGPVAFQADPSPQDAVRLARLATETVPRFPRPSRPEERELRPPGPLPEPELVGLLSDVTDLLAAARPRAAVVGRAVAFEQRVIVARAGRAPLQDERRGARLRFECRLPDSETAAVTELLLPRRAGDRSADRRSLAERLVRRAEELRDAREAPHGELPVVLGPGVGGVLVHEIVGHALEADRVLEAGTWLGQFEEPLAPRELLIVDDPRRGRAPWRIDDEGEPSKATPLIRDGRVAGCLHDRRTARATGQPPTGHGRCSSYRDPIQPRMGCTFVAPGKREPMELLRGIREGVYVRRMEAGTTDPRAGSAVFRVTDADRILNGKIDAPLRPHLLFVDGPRVLAAADRIANDLVFDSCIGSCHRDGRPLSISVGAPTMWIGLASVFVRESSRRDQR